MKPSLPTPLSLAAEPRAVLRGWPAAEPLLALHSGAAAGGRHRWNRYSILARPAAWLIHEQGRSRVIGGDFGVKLSHDPLDDLDRHVAATASLSPGVAPVPFTGGWIGLLGYDLGRIIEPVAAAPTPTKDDRAWPVAAMAWCPDALVHDHVTGVWYRIGQTLDVAPRDVDDDDAYELGRWHAAQSPDAYLAMVSRTLEAIAAGDIFQANMTGRFTASLAGSTRALADRALAASHAWYGAYLELPDGRRVISMSPELFLDVEARTREVVTRPIKGTRPSTVDPLELARSAKDKAELHMIVDLMRNDLGRVCEIGSVRVPAGRAIETHGTVHHGVGEVRGRLQAGVSPGDLLRATFPGGSVTGAPKIRAMQIIDRLEPVRRGPYCGSIGFIDRGGNIRLNIAIRTMAFTPEPGDPMRGILDYGVGGGIVADSVPFAELQECLDKAAVLRHLDRGGTTSRMTTPR